MYKNEIAPQNNLLNDFDFDSQQLQNYNKGVMKVVIKLRVINNSFRFSSYIRLIQRFTSKVGKIKGGRLYVWINTF